VDLVSGRQVEPSRFWLRRDDDDRARQVVYDEVQLNRYSDRQRRAIMKVMARGKTASHRDISQAVRRARVRPRGETLVAISLALSLLAVLVIALAGRHAGPVRVGAGRAAASARAAIAEARDASSGDLTTVMENADRAWLNDVGAGKVATASDGSDALSLPRSALPGGAPVEAAAGQDRAGRESPR
jgi:hypothetical protein